MKKRFRKRDTAYGTGENGDFDLIARHGEVGAKNHLHRPAPETVAAFRPPPPSPPDPLTLADKLKARSLICAWRERAVWSPDWHQRWLKANPEIVRRHKISTGFYREDGSEIGPDTDEKSINAEVIRKMLDDPENAAKEFGDQPFKIENTGTGIRGWTIKGALNLTALKFDKPLYFEDCVFSEALILTDAHLDRLTLRGSKLHSIVAENLHLDGGFSLWEGEVEYFTYLYCARIGGILNLHESRLNSSGEGEFALDCSGAIIGSALDLQKSVAVGGINLVGADIGNQLNCTGARFENEGQIALYCSVATIGAAVFLRDGFSAKGELNFAGTTITGMFDCADCTLENQGGVALNCSGTSVGSSVYLRDGFVAKGEVNFAGASIAGILGCSGCQFENQDGRALTCNRATIGSEAHLASSESSTGEIQMFTAKGEVNFVRAMIGGNLNCSGAIFENEGGLALTCNSAVIGSNVFLRSISTKGKVVKAFRALGEVNFGSATIKGQIDCTGAIFENGGKVCLAFESAKLEGDVFLCGILNSEGAGQKLIANGGVSFERAEILGHLLLIGANLDSPAANTLNLRAAKFGGILYLDDIDWGNCVLNLQGARADAVSDTGLDCWPKPGNLKLDGFRYESFADGFDHGRPVSNNFENRKAWLGRQYKNLMHRWRDFRPQPYSQCARALETTGHSRAARLIRHKREQYWTLSSSGLFTFSALSIISGLFTLTFRSLFDALAGYGLKIHQSLLWAIIAWGVGVPIYQAAYDTGHMSPDSERMVQYYAENCDPSDIFADANNNGYPGYQGMNAWIYSADAFLPIVDLEQTANWHPWRGVEKPGLCKIGGPLKNIRKRLPAFQPIHYILDEGWLPGFYWLQVGFGWLLTTIVVSGLTGLLQRGDKD